LVTKHSDGLLKLDIKEKLYGLFDSVFAVGDGRIDAGSQSVPAATGTYPLFDYGGIPGIFPFAPNAAYGWADSFLDPRMMEIWDKYSRPDGFKVLGATISMPQVEWSHRALRKVEDFKGLKTRTSGRTQTSALAAIGASPVTLSMAEVEEALYRGTVDAITTSKSYGSERGLIDLAEYCCHWEFSPVFAQLTLVNADTFDKLDPFFQEALLKAGADMTYEMTTVCEQMEITYTLWIQSSKCELIIPEKGEVEKGMALMGPVVEEWIEFSGPLAKDVLRVALDYATGPSVDVIKAALAK